MKMDDLKRIIKLAGRDYVDEADETPSAQGSASGYAPAATSAVPAASAAPADKLQTKSFVDTATDILSGTNKIHS
jgi:ATP-dependent protease HslVU (ClpYQ) peptidase subunit